MGKAAVIARALLVPQDADARYGEDVALAAVWAGVMPYLLWRGYSQMYAAGNPVGTTVYAVGLAIAVLGSAYVLVRLLSGGRAGYARSGGGLRSLPLLSLLFLGLGALSLLPVSGRVPLTLESAMLALGFMALGILGLLPSVRAARRGLSQG